MEPQARTDASEEHRQQWIQNFRPKQVGFWLPAALWFCNGNSSSDAWSAASATCSNATPNANADPHAKPYAEPNAEPKSTRPSVASLDPFLFR